MRITLYANRNMGMLVLSYLVAQGHDVTVITEDTNVRELAMMYKLNVVLLDKMDKFDLFICCHGRKIISSELLQKGIFINLHPCLFKYKGHNPVKRYIRNEDTLGSIESLYITEDVDGGDVIHREEFETPIVKTYAEFYNIATPFYFRCIYKTLQKLEKGGIINK